MFLVIEMSNKNRNKQNKKNNNLSHSNEEKKIKKDIKELKETFKKVIDLMPDDEFLDFCFALMDFSYDFDFDPIEDEGWEDEAEKFYNNEKNNISNFSIEDDDLPF